MKKISRKQFLSLAGMSALTLGLAACGGDSSSAANAGSTAASGAASGGSFEHKKIAIAWNGANDDVVQTKAHFDGEIGALLNLEFVHSEPISDAGALTTFIENSYASGCEAVLTNVSNAIDQAAAVCNDLGLYFVGISSSNAAENQDLPCYVSVCGASAEGYGDSYAEALTSVVGDGAEHSILILSGAACYGATSFIEGTVGSLRALEDVYGLTYNEDRDLVMDFTDPYATGMQMIIVREGDTTIAGTIELPRKVVDPCDGIFEVMLIKMPRSISDLDMAIRGLKNQDYSCPVIEFFQASKLSINNEPGLEWSLDGECLIPQDNFEFSVMPKFLELQG